MRVQFILKLNRTLSGAYGAVKLRNDAITSTSKDGSSMVVDNTINYLASFS